MPRDLALPIGKDNTWDDLFDFVWIPAVPVESASTALVTGSGALVNAAPALPAIEFEDTEQDRENVAAVVPSLTPARGRSVQLPVQVPPIFVVVDLFLSPTALDLVATIATATS